MIPLFSKSLEALDATDVRHLISEQFPEGSTVEFKEALPSKKGPEKWGEGGQLSDYARNKILEEIVAFANSYGGQLVLGIEESGDSPKRAVGIKPISQCADLAERLRLQARDCIEPQILLLSSRGIETADDDSGVVLLRVERSYLAPHRLMPTRALGLSVANVLSSGNVRL